MGGLAAYFKLLPIVQVPSKPTPLIKEEDEMTQQLPSTQKKDMKSLLAKAYKDKVFSVDHTSKVDKMTRGEALDLLVSYVSQTK